MTLPVAPLPATWPMRTSNQVYASDLNSQLSQAIAYLVSPPAFIGQQATTQSISGGVNTNVVLDKPVFDNYLSQNDVGFIKYNTPAGCGGIWLANGVVAYGGTSGANFDAFLNVNGSPVSGFAYPNRSSIQPAVTDLISMTPGQYVCLMALAGVNVSTATGANNFSYLNLRWVANASGTAGLTPPNPATWTPGQLCTATNFNTEIYNAVSFLSYVPYFRAAQTASQAVATSSNTAMTSMAATLDNYGSFASNTWTCQVAGTYLVGHQTGFTASAGAAYAASLITKIGGTNATYWTGATAGNTSTIVGGTKTFRFGAGDTVKLAGWQNSGGNLNTQGANTRFFTLWLSS
jgi:hypothetical protein